MADFSKHCDMKFWPTSDSSGTGGASLVLSLYMTATKSSSSHGRRPLIISTYTQPRDHMSTLSVQPRPAAFDNISGAIQKTDDGTLTKTESKSALFARCHFREYGHIQGK